MRTHREHVHHDHGVDRLCETSRGNSIPHFRHPDEHSGCVAVRQADFGEVERVAVVEIEHVVCQRNGIVDSG